MNKTSGSCGNFVECVSSQKLFISHIMPVVIANFITAGTASSEELRRENGSGIEGPAA